MLNVSPVSGLPLVEENEATGQVARIYGEVKREMQLPFIPNIHKALAVSPAALTVYWEMVRTFYQHVTLPQSLVAMILFTVATNKNCRYCSATHDLTCRTLGIDETTLTALVEDLENVSPERLGAIIEFAVKAAVDAQGLTAEDYEEVRRQGVSDAELTEIIFIAGLANLSDTLADALKIEVDSMVLQALGR
jgi:uncharacterized peroxidase-related enzyme